MKIVEEPYMIHKMVKGVVLSLSNEGLTICHLLIHYFIFLAITIISCIRLQMCARLPKEKTSL